MNRAGQEKVQLRTLADLLHAARNTDIGKRLGFKDIHSYADFAKVVPVVEYEDIRSDVMRMVAGERDVLWHCFIRSFAQSSGT